MTLLSALGPGIGGSVYRLCQCGLNRPLAAEDPRTQRVVRDARLLAPFNHRLGDPVESHKQAPSEIPHLLSSRGPAAIPGGIGAVVINTVQLMIGRRARPHVSVERAELPPLFAHLDSPPAVILVRRVAGALAASPHARPDFKLWRTAHPVLGAGKTIGGKPRVIKASARTRAPGAERVLGHLSNRATGASAYPERHRAGAAGANVDVLAALKNRPAAYLVARGGDAGRNCRTTHCRSASFALWPRPRPLQRRGGFLLPVSSTSRLPFPFTAFDSFPIRMYALVDRLEKLPALPEEL